MNQPTPDGGAESSFDRGGLAGVVVLELDNGLAADAGRLLGELGAQVIKIEGPRGDPSRRIGPFDAKTGQSLHFEAHNLNKSSVVLRLEVHSGRQSFLELVESADILLDGMGIGVMAGYRLDYGSLARVNPGLVYVSITPFGRSGPWQHLAGSDLVSMALGGVMAVTGYDAADAPGAPPICPVGGHSRQVSGVFAAIGAIAGLLRRDQTGSGDLVDISVHDTLAVSTEMSIPAWEFQHQVVHRHTARHSSIREKTAPWTMRCADGSFLCALTIYLTDDRFREMVTWFADEGFEDDLGDEVFEDSDYRAQNMIHITDVIARFCAHHDRAYLFAEAQRRRLPWSPIYSPDELLADPHLEARGSLVPVEVEDSVFRFYPGPGYTADGLIRSVFRRAPSPGEHSDMTILKVAQTD